MKMNYELASVGLVVAGALVYEGVEKYKEYKQAKIDSEQAEIKRQADLVTLKKRQAKHEEMWNDYFEGKTGVTK